MAPSDKPTDPGSPVHDLRRFILVRDEDVTGVSGIGVVAWGVCFPDGVVALRWKSEWPTSVVFHDRGMEAVEAVHGHGGKTRIMFLDEVDSWAPGQAVEPAVPRGTRCMFCEKPATCYRILPSRRRDLGPFCDAHMPLKAPEA